jgi:hypothetical protein
MLFNKLPKLRNDSLLLGYDRGGSFNGLILLQRVLPDHGVLVQQFDSLGGIQIGQLLAFFFKVGYCVVDCHFFYVLFCYLKVELQFINFVDVELLVVVIFFMNRQLLPKSSIFGFILLTLLLLFFVKVIFGDENGSLIHVIIGIDIFPEVDSACSRIKVA